eukprot:TRINITY_DN3928_c5_g1_i1.p1 TRINITY_DN3928_c5_g1~~TRINITY_DN3928_c5_g1_i1.p1  ORF type:complete len:312 (+),score=58.02 TRINITY_DN3928_c5_g1_i1:85-1020(+)
MSGLPSLFRAQQMGPKPVLSFRAGKMHKTGTTVRANNRKGMVQIIADDGCFSFQWKDRITGEVDESLFVFANEAEYFRVDKCTTGRVYCLRFKQGKEVFYWMQEPKTDKDDEYCNLINLYIRDPARCLAAARGQTDSEADVIEAMQEQFGSTGASTATAATGGDSAAPTGGGAQSQIDLNTLRSILGNMRETPGGGGSQPQPTQQAPPADVSLMDLFGQESVRQVLVGESNEFEARLSAHYPDGIDSNILEEIRSPQFKQTLAILQAALSDPEARRELSTAFGLPASTDLTRGGVDQFLKCIIEWQQKQNK